MTQGLVRDIVFFIFQYPRGDFNLKKPKFYIISIDLTIQFVLSIHMYARIYNVIKKRFLS